MQVSSFAFTTTSPKHFSLEGKVTSPSSGDPTKSFASALSSAFNKVNDMELRSEQLQQQMVSNPDSVNLHDVTIALTQAELALSFTKSVSTRVITAFNELTNLR